MTPLVSTKWVGERLHDDEIRIVDCRFHLDDPDRGRSSYAAGHIPSARYMSLEDDLTGSAGPGRHPLPDPGEFAERLGSFGIGSDHRVVAYDGSGGAFAARLWWMLRALGHKRVTVLDGGWEAWSAEPRSVTSEPTVWKPAAFGGNGRWTGTIDGELLAESLGDVVVIDARAADRYRGEHEPIDPVAGHIPGAMNIPYQGNTDEFGCFLPAQVLAERFAAAAAGRVVCYCGSGVTACSNLLAMAVAGMEGALLYPGSWSDWCTSGREIATATRAED